MRFGIFVEESAGCCGVSQLYGFSGPSYDAWPGFTIEGSGETEQAAYEDLFKNLLTNDPADDGNGRVYQIWFQKSADFAGKFDEHYLAEPFRLLIETIPNVMNLGEYVNYKSGNKIQGYQWEQVI